MPNSDLKFEFQKKRINAQLQIPLTDLEMSFGHHAFEKSDELLQNFEPELSQYILSHISMESISGKKWSIKIKKMNIIEQEASTGNYKELNVEFWMSPPKKSETEKFILKYDVVVHQVVTHITMLTLIKNQEDIFKGKIAMNFMTNILSPVEVDLTSTKPNVAGARSVILRSDNTQHVERNEKEFLDMSKANERFKKFKSSQK